LAHGWAIEEFIKSSLKNKCAYARKHGYLDEMTNFGNIASDEEEAEQKAEVEQEAEAEQDEEEEETEEDQEDEGNKDKGLEENGGSSDTDSV
jgi:hypothetical protein